MDAWIVEEMLPYRLIGAEARCGHVHGLECDRDRVDALFQWKAGGEEHYSEIVW